MRRWALIALALLTGIPPAGAADVLIFSKTAGYRHDSIPATVAAVRELAATAGLAVWTTEDARVFDDTGLRDLKVVVFAQTTGDVLDENQEAALQRFILAGGGWMGIHAAADAEYGWPWYEELVGARFAGHPPGLQTGTVLPDGPRDPLTAMFPPGGWTVTDEFYNFPRNPRGRVRVIATLDEAGYAGGTMGADHPIAWCDPVGRGRAFYTGLGHTARVSTTRSSAPTWRRAWPTPPAPRPWTANPAGKAARAAPRAPHPEPRAGPASLLYANRSRGPARLPGEAETPHLGSADPMTQPWEVADDRSKPAGPLPGAVRRDLHALALVDAAGRHRQPDDAGGDGGAGPAGHR